MAAPVNLYVAKSGSDSGNCQNSSAPCLTINYALAQGLRHDVQGDNLVVNIQGSGTWNESVMINSQLTGAANRRAIPQIGTVWPSMVVLNGNGSGNTTLTGDGGVCYTVGASHYGIIAVENITLTGTATGCQSTLFAQMGGLINVFGDVVFGAASKDMLHAEDAGDIELWQDYTIDGSASTFANSSLNSVILVNAGTGTIRNTPNFSASFFYGQNNGGIQLNPANPFRGAATGRQFTLLSNSTLVAYDPPAKWPGDKPGIVTSGGRFQGAADACVGGTRGCAATAAPTGLGSTGAASLTAGSSPYGGQIVLSPAGSGVQDRGHIQIGFPYQLVPGFCTAAGGVGSASWGNASFVSDNITAVPSIYFYWSNGGATLSSRQTYRINYTCQGN